jgi:hypothetical protein
LNDIYCNYFTDYCGSGRYNVSVSAKSELNIYQNKFIKTLYQTIFIQKNLKVSHRLNFPKVHKSFDFS